MVGYIAGQGLIIAGAVLHSRQVISGAAGALSPVVATPGS
jgi:hypothetical protein